MKPWQFMSLFAITLGFVTYWIDTLTPEGFFTALGMAAAIVVIGMVVMRPKRTPDDQL